MVAIRRKSLMRTGLIRGAANYTILDEQDDRTTTHHLVISLGAKIPRPRMHTSPHAPHRQPSFKPAAWLPRLSRAPSQLSRRDRMNVTAHSLRLSGESPDSRSGDAKEA